MAAHPFYHIPSGLDRIGFVQAHYFHGIAVKMRGWLMNKKSLDFPSIITNASPLLATSITPTNSSPTKSGMIFFSILFCFFSRMCNLLLY